MTFSPMPTSLEEAKKEILMWRELYKRQAAQPAHAHAIDTSPEGWREFIENIAKAGSEPLNSLAGGSDKASRRHWLGVIRNRARDLLAAAPSRIDVPWKTSDTPFVHHNPFPAAPSTKEDV